MSGQTRFPDRLDRTLAAAADATCARRNREGGVASRRTPRQYLLGRDLRDGRALGRDERGRARRDEAVGRRLAEGHGALVRRDVGVDRAGLDELEVLFLRALPSQQRAEPARTSSARWRW